jgi:hypothetical protein
MSVEEADQEETCENGQRADSDVDTNLRCRRCPPKNTADQIWTARRVEEVFTAPSAVCVRLLVGVSALRTKHRINLSQQIIDFGRVGYEYLL